MMSNNPYEPSNVAAEPLRLPERPFNKQTEIAFAASQILVGLVGGFIIWAVTAPKEAWDVNPYYSLCVLAAGLVASFARPRRWYWGIVGVYAGQVLALHALMPSGGIPIMPPFLGVLFFGTLPAAVGAAVGAGIGYCFRYAIKR